MDISAIAPALPYYRPSMDISAIAPRQPLLRCPTTTTMDGGSADIAGVNICPSIRPTWMWEVWKMQGAIFNHGHMHCPNKLHLTSMDGGNAIGL
jgi:hypothetical protein